MSKGTDKLSAILKQLKKLPASRKTYWLKQIDTLKKSTSKLSKELGAEAHIIQMPVTNISSTLATGESDWLLDTANWLDSVYSGVQNTANKAVGAMSDFGGQVALDTANRLDKIYTAVSDEVVKIPGKTGKAIGQLTGTGDMWPYVLGAGVALGAVYYFTQISPIKRFI